MPEVTPATPTPVTPASNPAPVATTPAKVETTPATATPAAAPAPDPKVSSAFAQLTKKERQLEAERRTWKAQREQEAAEHAADIKAAREWRALQADVKKMPLKALEVLGVSYDEISQAQLNDGIPPPDLAVRSVEEKLEAYKAEVAAKEKAREEELKKAQQTQEQRDLAEARQVAAKQVVDGGEKFELVNALGLQDYVVRMVEEHLENTGEWVPPDAAAAKLEEHLQAGQELPDVPFDTAFKKLTATKWFQSKYAPVAPKEEVTPKEAPTQSTRIVTPERKPEAPTSHTITPRMGTSRLAPTHPTVARHKGAADYRAQKIAEALAKSFPGAA